MNKRYGMSIDIDKCTGCGACMVACAVENNVPPVPGANERRGITWMRVYQVDNGEEYPERRSAFVPMMCQQCGVDTPCAHVCPQQAVDVDPATGIVGEIPTRCLGCRYCVAACPYHARYFNWWDPAWPAGMEKTLNPDVAPRMRGVVEKCNFCHGRWHRARESAAAAGKQDIQPGEYTPACVEACPAGAIQFGDLNDPSSEVAAARQDPASFRLLEKLGTDTKIYYHSKRDWVRQIAYAPRPGEASGGAPRRASGGAPGGAPVGAPRGKENIHG
jgi:molybdopterin-containing oxidoreductase family iron-sulfur binding subunit